MPKLTMLQKMHDLLRCGRGEEHFAVIHMQHQSIGRAIQLSFRHADGAIGGLGQSTDYAPQTNLTRAHQCADFEVGRIIILDNPVPL